MNKLNFDWDNNTWKIISKYFKTNNVLVKHHLDSYNYFINNDIQNIVNEKEFFVKASDEWSPIKKIHLKEYHVRFKNIYINKPLLYENNGISKPLYPIEARLRNLTYDSTLYIDIEHFMIIRNEDNDKEIIKKYKTLEKFECGKIPVMINSDLCNMKNNINFTKNDMGECEYDNGGYFIVKGSEKVIVSQERKRENKVYCFKQKLVQSKYSHETEISSINSKSPAFVISTKVRLNIKRRTKWKID